MKIVEVVNTIISFQKPFNPYTLTIALNYILAIKTMAFGTF